MRLFRIALHQANDAFVGLFRKAMNIDLDNSVSKADSSSLSIEGSKSEGAKDPLPKVLLYFLLRLFQALTFISIGS